MTNAILLDALKQIGAITGSTGDKKSIIAEFHHIANIAVAMFEDEVARDAARDLERNAHGLSQAKAQTASIAAMVAALECDYDRLEELKDELETTHADQGGEATFDDWIKAEWKEGEDAYDDVMEYRELLEAAGECTSQDEAHERIQEDALEVQVRSGWESRIDSDTKPAEFYILLCTGGPACRIMGELDEHGQPDRAWIEYQDWGTPWTQLVDAPIEQSTLLTYCQQFYFGE